MSFSIETLSVHSGREDYGSLGIHASPIDLSTTYPIHHLDHATASLDELVAGNNHAPNPIYARLHNPTVARFEAALAQLEGTEEAVAFGSGMATLTACILAVKSPEKKHLVAVRPVYGGSDHLLSSPLLDIETTWVAQDEIFEAIQPNTALILIETPANPTLDLVDIAYVVAQAGNVPVLVDSTFATPILQNPIAHGASMVLHSATKFLGGHGDVMGGIVATSELWASKLRQVRILTGALMHPLGGYLLHRGLQTLALRVEKAQENAIILAENLLHHPAVSQVHFPTMNHDLSVFNKQMRGPGSLIAFELEGGHESARNVLQHVHLCTPAVSLGSVDTLIQHPAGLTHRILDEETREATGITEGLLRLSVGIENVTDIWNDLEHALSFATQCVEMA